MVGTDNHHLQIQGSEGIILHKGNIVLGMQKQKRWYTLSNDERAAIIKTIGGQVSDSDKNDTRITLFREITEEIKGLKSQDITISQKPIFTKKVRMNAINPYEQRSNLTMEADFYFVKISEKIKIFPNDLPALLEIPINTLIKLEFCNSIDLDNLRKFLILNQPNDINLPKRCALMIPNEVKDFIKEL